jgi:hypothetical protein
MDAAMEVEKGGTNLTWRARACVLLSSPLLCSALLCYPPSPVRPGTRIRGLGAGGGLVDALAHPLGSVGQVNCNRPAGDAEEAGLLRACRMGRNHK